MTFAVTYAIITNVTGCYEDVNFLLFFFSYADIRQSFCKQSVQINKLLTKTGKNDQLIHKVTKVGL